MRRLALLALLVAGCAAPRASQSAAPFAVYEEPSLTCDASQGGAISGTVRHRDTDVPLGNALVVLESSALAGDGELTTDEYGRFRFDGLPPGTYTVLVLVGQAAVSQVFTLPEHATYRANFAVDPERHVIACGCSVPPLDQSLLSVTDEAEARLLGMPKTRYGL